MIAAAAVVAWHLVCESRPAFGCANLAGRWRRWPLIQVRRLYGSFAALAVEEVGKLSRATIRPLVSVGPACRARCGGAIIRIAGARLAANRKRKRNKCICLGPADCPVDTNSNCGRPVSCLILEMLINCRRRRRRCPQSGQQRCRSLVWHFVVVVVVPVVQSSNSAQSSNYLQANTLVVSGFKSQLDLAKLGPSCNCLFAFASRPVG